ncbi:hypothetical protein [Nocardioides sp.]|uniref:hypothetical protein n=1 Tax=Nocardioides sp. TaxID=35761 RepID=UPI002734B7EB|nr:hypothetical protein [Nocardioides sp.]MDP3889770.1 hypothetical protein [Nocardioides sp.]
MNTHLRWAVRCVAAGVLTLPLLTIITTPASAAPPVNDNFADAIVLDPAGGIEVGDSTEATGEPGEPVPGTANSVWYRWTPAGNTRVTMYLCDSSYDTYLQVFTGAAVNALTLVAENDDSGDFCGNANSFNSRLAFNAVGGTTYSIQVDGFSGARGAFRLAVIPHTGNWVRDPVFLNLGTQPLGTIGPAQTLRFINTGAVAKTDVTTRQTGPDDYLVLRETCPGATVSADLSCTARVRFAPEQSGPRPGGQYSVDFAVGVSFAGVGGALPEGPPGPQGPTGATGATGPQGPPGRDAKVKCVVKRKGTKIKVKCKVVYQARTSARVRALLVRDDRVVAVGKKRVSAGRAVVPLKAQRSIRKGRYDLFLTSRHQGVRKTVYYRVRVRR